MLSVASNRLTTIPVCVAQLTNLDSLDLENNRINCVLARSPIAALSQLQLLTLTGNEVIVVSVRGLFVFQNNLIVVGACQDIADLPSTILKKMNNDGHSVDRWAVLHSFYDNNTNTPCLAPRVAKAIAKHVGIGPGASTTSGGGGNTQIAVVLQTT
jgi:Leucine-rich repeat (LRR) protein